MAMNGDISTNAIRKITLDARVPAEPDAVLSPAKPRQKKPQWFTPILEPGEIRDVSTPPLDVDEAMLSTPANYAMVVEVLDASVALISERVAPLRVKLAGLEVENAQLRGLVAELKAKLSELDFITERLRVENKGPPGMKGERGRDGRDGALGPRGERGERGEKGKPAPLIIGWRTDPEAFTVQALLSDGSVAPPLNLMGLFQAYDSATGVLDDRDVAAAAEEARTEAERQAEAARWTK
jgi:hypothetical protein